MPPLQPEPSIHPVPRLPAPWTLKAESYLLFLRLPSLPPGVYDPVHARWADPACGTFTGGLGCIMIVRYTDTPVGAYDELMLIPGSFTVPQPDGVSVPKKALRISRIYVSQRTTMYNGRLNWNIPKHLARFEFSAAVTRAGQTPPTSLSVKVFPPDSSEKRPFFQAKLTPFRWIPAIPTNTAYIPMSLLNVQPPLPEPASRMAAAKFEAERAAPIDAYDVSGKNEEALLVGTERWAAWELVARARARGCWVDVSGGEGERDGKAGGKEEEEEGKWWPRGVRPWGVGAWMEGGEFEIKEAVEWKL